MARYQVILAYDGTAFNGMQRQAHARTVQGEVEDALTKIGWKGRSILAAGRTDSGVHASGQVIAFDLDWGHTPEDLLNALNASLPEDVAAQAVREADPAFHPRYQALSRTYRYQLFCQPQRNPLRERYAWRVWPQLGYERITAGAGELVGAHDFCAFGSPPQEGGPTQRLVEAAVWEQAGDAFVFEITANAFLYHMVRRIVILLVEVGHGRQSPNVIGKYLNGQIPGMVQGLAPPHGLSLAQVIYPLQIGQNLENY